jgi:hypothetical protein
MMSSPIVRLTIRVLTDHFREGKMLPTPMAAITADVFHNSILVAQSYLSNGITFLGLTIATNLSFP